MSSLVLCVCALDQSIQASSGVPLRACVCVGGGGRWLVSSTAQRITCCACSRVASGGLHSGLQLVAPIARP
jgi:hypothetical protein